MLVTAEQEVAALQRRFEADVQSHLRSALAEADSDVARLLRYHLGWEEADGTPAIAMRGKGLRPVLCLMACDLAGGDWHKALPAAAAIELIHNFSLIHDDIQDRDVTRWGRTTLWAIHGESAAVTAGNAMRVIADQTLLALADTGMPPALVAEAAGVTTLRYMEMIEGQYLDMAFEQAGDVTVEDYIDMIGRKTGALIDSALYTGALVATADPSVARAFGNCGRKLGLAFQIRDDYLGVWGNSDETGKAVGADIRRKKKSMPVVHLFQNATPAERVWLDETYTVSEVVGADLQRVFELLERTGTAAYVQRSAEEQAASARSEVHGLGLSEEAERKLGAMAEFFVTREK